MEGKVICTTCGFVGKPKKDTKGSFFTELILWFCFLLPGVIYSLWRIITRKYVCSKCYMATIIPLDTPKGQELLKSSKR